MLAGRGNNKATILATAIDPAIKAKLWADMMQGSLTNSPPSIPLTMLTKRRISAHKKSQVLTVDQNLNVTSTEGRAKSLLVQATKVSPKAEVPRVVGAHSKEDRPRKGNEGKK